MRTVFFAFMMMVFLGITHGYAQDSPSDVLRSALDSVAIQLAKQSENIIQMDRIFPVVSSELPEDLVQPITDLWRRSLNATGKEVYLTPQTGTYRVELRVETYAIHLNSEKSGWFGKRDLSGILNLDGGVLVADTTGKVIQTMPVEISESFIAAENRNAWYAEATQQHFPMHYNTMQDRPEIRTILLAITTAMIIYLFYSMRG